MKRIAVGIIGCGTIGAAIARACVTRLRDRVRLAAVCDTDPVKLERVRAVGGRGTSALTAPALIRSVDIVVEAACGPVAASVLAACVARKRCCLIMSVGGLVGHERLLKSAERRGVRVFLPSGALCGIDGLKAARVGRIESVTLTTRKPPAGLAGSPLIAKRGIDLARITGETLIYEGSAAEAVKAFPQNVNVSALLGLAGIGAKLTRVRIVSDPSYTRNVHEVSVAGEFGSFVTRTENVPSRENPKTSAMAFYSAIATLENATSSVSIGT